MVNICCCFTMHCNIDELSTHIINHFQTAAQIGAQVIAENSAQANAKVSAYAEIVNDNPTETDVKTIADKSFKKLLLTNLLQPTIAL